MTGSEAMQAWFAEEKHHYKQTKEQRSISESESIKQNITEISELVTTLNLEIKALSDQIQRNYEQLVALQAKVEQAELRAAEPQKQTPENKTDANTLVQSLGQSFFKL